MATRDRRNGLVDLRSLIPAGSDDESSSDGGCSPPYPFRHPPLDSPQFADNSWRLPVPDPCTPYTSMDEERLKVGKFRLKLMGDEYRRRKALGLIAKSWRESMPPPLPPFSLTSSSSSSSSSPPPPPLPPSPSPPPSPTPPPSPSPPPSPPPPPPPSPSSQSVQRGGQSRPLRRKRRRSDDQSPPPSVPRRESVRLLRIKEQRLSNPSPNARRRESVRLLHIQLRRLSDRPPSPAAASTLTESSTVPAA